MKCGASTREGECSKILFFCSRQICLEQNFSAYHFTREFSTFDLECTYCKGYYYINRSSGYYCSSKRTIATPPYLHRFILRSYFFNYCVRRQFSVVVSTKWKLSQSLLTCLFSAGFHQSNLLQSLNDRK